MSYSHKKIKSSKITSSFQICWKWYNTSCNQNQFFLIINQNNLPPWKSSKEELASQLSLIRRNCTQRSLKSYDSIDIIAAFIFFFCRPFLNVPVSHSSPCLVYPMVWMSILGIGIDGQLFVLDNWSRMM